MPKRIAVFILLAIQLLFLSGCWGKAELNEIGIVTVTGVDLDPDGSIRITVLSVQPEGSAQAPPTRSSTWIGTATGKDLAMAKENLNGVAVKKLSWLHNFIFIVGRDLAQSRMDEVIDIISRNRQIRFNSFVLVADGRAFDLLQAPSDIQKDLSVELQGLVRNLDQWSDSYAANIKEFLVSFAEQSGEIVTGRIYSRDEARTSFSTDRENYEKLVLAGKKIPVLYMGGSAVFKDGNFIGWLDSKQTRGYMWLTSRIKPNVILTSGNKGELALRIQFSSTKVDVKGENGNYTARVKTDVRGMIYEQTSSQNIRDENQLKEVEKGFEETIRSDIEAVMEKLQKEYSADVLKFGSKLCKANPGEWKKAGSDWEDSFFPRVRVETEIKVTIERTGKIINTIFR